MNVRLDRDKCIGCSACMTVCPLFWSMGEDGKTRLKGGLEVKSMPGWYRLELKDTKAEVCNRRAADICPVRVIHVE